MASASKKRAMDTSGDQDESKKKSAAKSDSAKAKKKAPDSDDEGDKGFESDDSFNDDFGGDEDQDAGKGIMEWEVWGMHCVCLSVFPLSVLVDLTSFCLLFSDG